MDWQILFCRKKNLTLQPLIDLDSAQGYSLNSWKSPNCFEAQRKQSLRWGEQIVRHFLLAVVIKDTVIRSKTVITCERAYRRILGSLY